MSERQTRSAFDQLKMDVMTNVNAEQRLQQITEGPRLRWQRPAIALAGAAAAVLVVGVGIGILLSDGNPDPAPPIADGTSTTVVDSTTVPSQTGLPDLSTGTVVIVESGATASAADGVVVVDADTAVGDGAGGLVVLRDDTILRTAGDGTEISLLDATDLVGEFGPVSLRLEDSALVDGSMRAVVVVAYGQEYPDVFQEIWLLDLDSGATQSVYQMVAVESTITRVSVAGGSMVVSISFEGGTYFEYLDTTGNPTAVAAPYGGGLLGSVPDFPIAIDQGVLSPDATTLAYIEIDVTGGYPSGGVVDLVIWDLTNGTEQQRLEIELGDVTSLGRVDYNGHSVVVGRARFVGDDPQAVRELLTPLRVEPDTGTISELDTPGTPTLIK